MKPNKNPYEFLRQPGIRGKAVSYDYDSKTIYNSSKLSLVIHTGEMIPGVWDFGYTLIDEGAKEFKAPGEGAGWFCSRKDAQLFALGLIRMRFDISEDEISSYIDKEIGNISIMSLF